MAKDISAAPRRRQSVTRHPLFPLLLALWFAALFALSSFALRDRVIESWVVTSGFDTIVPAAAPPLGATARILLALICAGLGGVVGMAIGRAMARQEPGRPSARRASASTEVWSGVALEDAAPVADAAEHGTLETPEPVQELLEPLPAPAPARESTAAQRIATADLDDLSHVELIERLAIALERRRERGGTIIDSGGILERGQEALREFLQPARVISPAQPSGEGVVSFPDHAARRDARRSAHTASSGHDPVATERALRDALASLQRMSRSN